MLCVYICARIHHIHSGLALTPKIIPPSHTELRANLRMLGRDARFQQCVCLAALFSALLALWQAFLV